MNQTLNYNWDYIDNYKESYLTEFPTQSQKIDIPHSLVELPYNYFSEDSYQKIVTYRKIFDVEDQLNKDKISILRFDGFMMKAKIYLNKEYLGQFVSGYIQVKIDISKYIKQKDNELIVVLDSTEDPLIPPFGYAVDYLTYSGIYREVFLEVHPRTYLENIYVHGDSKGFIDIDYDVVNATKDVKIDFEIFNGEHSLERFSSNQFILKNPILWDISNPFLYKMVIRLRGQYGEEYYEQMFGFKDAEFRKDGFYLNNKKLKLVGLNRHQGYPIMGYAASKSLQREDADILKFQVGVNVVRTSHYPQSEHFLARCDEIGLLVINEIPGWQHISNKKEWRDQYYEDVKRMVLVERKYTSVIAHGVRIDESKDDHELYSKGNEIAHSLDKYKQTIGVRNFRGSELLEDVYGYNDFSSDRLEHGLDDPHKTIKDKPYLVTEYLGHMDPVKAGSDEHQYIETALRHARVINDNFKYNYGCGAIGWCFVDYHTHADFGAGDHICPHGVMDLYRNPKYSSFIYASQQDEYPVLKILSNMKPGDFAEAIYEKIYVATNCDYVKLYKNGEYVATFYPNKKEFPNLKHPPIIIDDIVGETLKDERMSKKDEALIAKLLTKSGIVGFGHMSKADKLKLAMFMLKYKTSYQDVVDLWNEHIAAWGGLAKTFVFKGYIKDKEVISEESGPSKQVVLDAKLIKKVLVNEDTFDTTRIVVKHLDEHGSLCRYSNRVIHIETSGPIKLYGEPYQALLGGQLSVYIRSENKPGKGNVKISMDRQVKEFEIEVK